MEQNEKLTLYKYAKEKYYNGEPIMGDAEFDALEKELGLNNKGFIGTRHNPSYTEEHPFVMGSLSKVQIKENEELLDGNVFIKYIRTLIKDDKKMILKIEKNLKSFKTN